MHPKNYLAPWFPNSIKKSLPFKTQSTITMYSNSVRYTPLKTSISTPLRARYQHLNKLNNGIRKTRKPKFRRVLYTDLGDGDVQKVAGNNPLVELTSHELNSSTISNTSLTSNSFPNIQETVNINRNLCSTKFSNDSHRDNHKNLTIFMYRADDMTNKNQQSSAQKEEGRDSYYSIDVKSSSRIQGDENQTSSQDDGSDIYKFKPDVTIIDEAYLERIIHLWLKSGLRQHVSQLSNLKLRPVYEWGRRYRVLPEEPQPVLETLDVEPVHITTVSTFGRKNISFHFLVCFEECFA